MNRDEHERKIFLQALNLPEPYDLSEPFDADRLVSGFKEEARILRAADDPVLDGLAQLAREAWATFLAKSDNEAS